MPQVLDLTRNQQLILREVAAQQFSGSGAWIGCRGDHLRVKWPHVAEARIDEQIDELVPRHLNRQGARPNETYTLTVEGLVHTVEGARASLLMEQGIDLVKETLAANPQTTSLDWSTFRDRFGMTDNDFDFADAVFHIAGWVGTGGNGPESARGGKGWLTPPNLPRIVRCRDFSDLLELASSQPLASSQSLFVQIPFVWEPPADYEEILVTTARALGTGVEKITWGHQRCEVHLKNRLGADKGKQRHLSYLFRARAALALRRSREREASPTLAPAGVSDVKVVDGTLPDETQILLDDVAAQQVRDAEPPLLRGLLMSASLESADVVNKILQDLDVAGLVKISGASGFESVQLTRRGLLRSAQAPKCDRLVTCLLEYFRERGAKDPMGFRVYSWEDLKAAGVAAGDEDFGAMVVSIRLLGLSSGGSPPFVGPPPAADWPVPISLSHLRGITDLHGLVRHLNPSHTSPSTGAMMSTTPSGSKTITHDGMSKVFIVHGHDEKAKLAVQVFLQKLGLEPIILHELPNRGRTIIEKIEENADVDFSLVLLTPDDEGKKASDTGPARPRARQNVVLELGYFIAKLEREHVCALYKKGVELPSDYDGVLWVEMDDGGAWQLKIIAELKAAGIQVDANNLTKR